MSFLYCLFMGHPIDRFSDRQFNRTELASCRCGRRTWENWPDPFDSHRGKYVEVVWRR